MPDKSERKRPSDATQARRDAKILLAPFVTNLSSWHQQAARLLLEVDRAEALGAPQAMPAAALRHLIDTVRRAQAAFARKTAALTSSRVDDVERSFKRLLSDLQRASARCKRLSPYSMATSTLTAAAPATSHRTARNA
jgi:hypothetical protein